MPAIITHYLMSKASADSLGNNNVLQCVKQYSEVFFLGAQCPDILFFALGNKELNQLGERMHREGINSFFAECINRIRMIAIHEGRDEITAFIAGVLCHYAMDTCAHPYIYYKTGFFNDDGEQSGESVIRHRFLETTIDVMLARNLEDSSPYSLNFIEKFTVRSKTRLLIGQFLSNAVTSSYGVFLYPEDYAKAMKDMAFVYRILRDKSGKKRVTAGILGKLFRNIAAVEALMHYEPVKQLDYLNEKRSIWHYPWDDSIDINLSFMDLFNRAIDDSRIYITAFSKAVNKQIDDKIALSIIGNKNFSTGLESPAKFLYYNIEF